MKNNIRSLFCIILCFAIVLPLFGCEDDEKTEAPKSTQTIAVSPTDSNNTIVPSQDSTTQPTAEPTIEPTIEPTQEPTVEPTIEPTKKPTVAPTAKPTTKPTATVKPTPTVAPTMTYEQLVDKLMSEAQKVTDFMRAQRFTYGDARINPAYNWGSLSAASAINPSEKIVSCDRLVDWILFRAGFTEQSYVQGMTVRSLVPWCEEHGFQKITNVNNLKAGDIVFVYPSTPIYAKHVFMCASSKLADGTYLRYDAGSDARITGVTGTEVTRGKQPFKEAITGFMYAYRPCTDKMPGSTSIYNKPTSTEAVISNNATELFNANDYTWAAEAKLYELDYKYQPGTDYDQYELHVNVASKPYDSDTNHWNACYVGARVPELGYAPHSHRGGIWVAFAEDYASIYFGTGSWPVQEAKVTLPVNVSTGKNIVVVDDGRVIKYYLETSANTRKLLLSITVDVNSDKAVVWSSNNSVLYIGTAKFNKSGYFSLWSHIAQTTVSDISIKGSN